MRLEQIIVLSSNDTVMLIATNTNFLSIYNNGPYNNSALYKIGKALQSTDSAIWINIGRITNVEKLNKNKHIVTTKYTNINGTKIKNGEDIITIDTNEIISKDFNTLTVNYKEWL